VPADWDASKDPLAIPEGQAELNALIEDVHNGIYDMLCAYESSAPEQTTAWSSVTKDTVGAVQSKLSELVESLKQGSTEAKTRLGQAISKGYAMLNEYLGKTFAVREMVDPKLADVNFELTAILDGLKKLRNQWLLFKLSEAEQVAASHEATKTFLKQRLQNYRERLVNVENQKQDGRFLGDDGSFAPQGQAYLNSLMEEAYAIASELTSD
jgi:NADH dehydrogenase/NADH:ubiquinone oxidoreductase subunit G